MADLWLLTAVAQPQARQGYASRDGLPDAEAVTPPEVIVALLVVRAAKFA